MRFSDWLYTQIGRTDSIALVRLMQLLFEFFTQQRGLDPVLVAPVLWSDYRRGGRHDKPSFLLPHLSHVEEEAVAARPKSGPRRQSRHVAAQANNL
jgi:hypothetical protein